MPLSVRLWFVWAFILLAITGLLLGRIVEFIDFSERAPFSLLGIFMMVELALVLFGITVALQRKRIAHRFAIGIALLPCPGLGRAAPGTAGLSASRRQWVVRTHGALGALVSVVLVVGLLRDSARAWFSEP